MRVHMNSHNSDKQGKTRNLPKREFKQENTLLSSDKQDKTRNLPTQRVAKQKREFKQENTLLSVVILTFNSAKYLREVLKSASFADEIIVLDSGSSDQSEQIAKSFENVKFIKHEWLGFGAMKKFGVNLAKNEWIFVLDSDEIITKSLQDELINTLKNPAFKAYKVARLNYFFGAPLRHLGLYPDYTIRFFNKNYANFNEDNVHERVITKCEIGTLKEHFLHYAYENVEQFISKQNRYSSLNAKKSRFKALFSPAWTFVKLYVIKLGFMDGWRGFVVAKLYAQYTFWKYIK